MTPRCYPNRPLPGNPGPNPGKVAEKHRAADTDPTPTGTHIGDMTMPQLRVLLVAGLVFLALTAHAEPVIKTDMVVIAPRQFHAALAEFIQYKQSLLRTRLVALENILEQSPGGDDPEKLKRWLYQTWKSEGIGYALLVGDGDIMPMRFMVLDRVTPPAFDYAFYPSDLYYADLAKSDGGFENWNGQSEGFHARYFGEVRGEKNKSDPINFDNIDYRPEIAVGRWPANTVAEIERIAVKSMATEKRILDGSHPGLKRAALMAVGGWVDSRPHLDRVAATLPTGWTTEKRYFAPAGMKSETGPPNSGQLLPLLNSGLGIVFHAGHGTDHQWEQCLSTRHIDGMHNADRLPIMISAGCSTATFAPMPPYSGYVDESGAEHRGTNAGEVFTAPPPPPNAYQKGKYNPTGLGEQLLKRNRNGAVAYIGCNTGSQPCALTLLEGFARGLREQAAPRLGDAWSFAIRHYFDHEHLATLKPNRDWYPPSIFFQGMKFMLFGDPSLQITGPAKQ